MKRYLIKPSTLLILVMLFLISSSCYAQTFWTGAWETNWQDGSAKMHLVQSGNKVTGTYTHKNGQIDGEISGNRLVGNWHQNNGNGTFVFTMKDGGASFSGVYGDGQWWNGTRDSTYILSWTGTWNTNWQDGNATMHLVQSGNKVTGTYTHKDGQIDGEVSGNRLAGNWYQNNGNGTFVFTMANNGISFSGIYGNDEWWNGIRDVEVIYVISSAGFAGTWIGNGYSCEEGGLQEKINITVNNGNLVATKITGDSCVPAGNITFQGTIPDNVTIGSSFPVTWTTGTSDNPASSSTISNLEILNADSFTSYGVTFTREVKQ